MFTGSLVSTIISAFTLGDMTGNHMTTGVFLIIGCLLFAVGTALRKVLPVQAQRNPDYSNVVWRKTASLSANPGAKEAVSKRSASQRHANAM